MSEFGPTAARQAELTALLDDEQHFTAAYPRVADYLATAPRLPGTGHETADAAFDLRLLDVMTRGDLVGANPYWDIVGPSVSPAPAARGGRREVNGTIPHGSPRLGFAQAILQACYAYAVPSPETLRWIGACCEGSPVTEIGAGRGYWAQQLEYSGVPVAAYDAAPPDLRHNSNFPPAAGQRDTWHPVADLTAVHWSGARVLLLVWPPGWGNPMASLALEQYRRAGGSQLIYIGESRGGKTGDEEFFDALDAEWQLTDRDDAFVSWWNLHDRAQYWTRA